jgi:nascent polypeptide-associated complex subunit alpha
MMPNLNPGQMRKMMQRMGIQQQEIDATEVIIRTAEKDIVISEPNVTKVNMMGQETFQVTGKITERTSEPGLDDGDIKTVMAQANVSREEAVLSLKNNDYDLAKAILELTHK